LKCFIFRHFPPQKLRRQLRLLGHPSRLEQIGIAQLVLALAGVLHLDQAFFNQSLEAEIDRAKPHNQMLYQCTLTDLGRLIQKAQDFKLDFRLKTSQFL